MTATIMTTTTPAAPAAAPPALARVRRVLLRGWQGLDHTYNLGVASALLRGANGAGKTALIDALRFAVEGVGRAGRRPEDAWRHARSGEDELAVTVELATGFSWTRYLARSSGPDGDKIAGRLILHGRERLKTKAAEEALRAELGALPAQWDLAGGYHGLSAQAKRTFLISLLGGVQADDLPGRLKAATWDRLGGTMAEPEGAAGVADVLAEIGLAAHGADAAADLLAMGEAAKAAVSTRAAAVRETGAAVRALQDQAVVVAGTLDVGRLRALQDKAVEVIEVSAGTAAQAEADLARLRVENTAAVAALAAGCERAAAHARAAQALGMAEAELEASEDAAADAALDPGPDVDALRAALEAAGRARAQAVLIVAEAAAEMQRVVDQAKREDAAFVAAKREAEAASETVAEKLRAAAEAAEAARGADAELRRAMDDLAAREAGPASEALRCWECMAVDISMLRFPRWLRLGELLRAWASPTETEALGARVKAFNENSAHLRDLADNADGAADVAGEAADALALLVAEARALVAASSGACAEAAAAWQRAARAAALAASAVVWAEEALRSALAAVSHEGISTRLAAAQARHAEAQAAADATPAPPNLIELESVVIVTGENGIDAETRLKRHQESGSRARNLAEALERARRAEAEHAVAVAVQRAVQDVREAYMARVVAPLTAAMGAVIREAWPAAPGATVAEVYAELETLHGQPAAELGVRLEGADGATWRVSYETMSGAQAAVFDAALVAAFLARSTSRLAVLGLEVDALSGPVAVGLLRALDAHAPHVQVLAATWQEIAPPSEWTVIEVGEHGVAGQRGLFAVMEK